MKKISTLLLTALLCLSVSAREAQTVTWDLTANEAALGLKLLGDNTGHVTDTTVLNGVQYLAQFIHPRNGAGATTSGLYCHNSNSSKKDNYLEIYVPAGVKGNLSITFATGSGSNTYNFFANIQDYDAEVPATLYDTINVASSKIMSFSTSKSTAKTLDDFAFDFSSKSKPQVIRIFHVSSTGGRFRKVVLTETAVTAMPAGTFTLMTADGNAEAGWINFTTKTGGADLLAGNHDYKLATTDIWAKISAEITGADAAYFTTTQPDANNVVTVSYLNVPNTTGKYAANLTVSAYDMNGDLVVKDFEINLDANAEGVATSLTEVNYDTNLPMYTILGTLVTSDYKGVVIQNGKKYILR